MSEPTMVGCTACEAPISGDDYDRATVVRREPRPGVYFQMPDRTWELEHKGVVSYMVGTTVYCKACYAAQVGAAS